MKNPHHSHQIHQNDLFVKNCKLDFDESVETQKSVYQHINTIHQLIKIFTAFSQSIKKNYIKNYREKKNCFNKRVFSETIILSFSLLFIICELLINYYICILNWSSKPNIWSLRNSAEWERAGHPQLVRSWKAGLNCSKRCWSARHSTSVRVLCCLSAWLFFSKKSQNVIFGE